MSVTLACEFLDRVVAINAREGRIRHEVVPVRGRLEDAFDRVFKNAAVFFLGGAQGGFHALTLGDLRLQGLIGAAQIVRLPPQRAADAARDEGDEADRREQRAGRHQQAPRPALLVGFDALLEQRIHFLIGDPPKIEARIARHRARGQILLGRDVHSFRDTTKRLVSRMNFFNRGQRSPAAPAGTRS